MHPSFSPSYRPRGGYRQLGSSSLYFNDGSKIPGARIDARPRAARMMGGDEGQLSSRGQFWGNPDFRPAASMPEQPKGRWVPGNSAGSQVFIPEGKNDPLGRKEFNPPPTPAAATTTSTAPTAPATTATTPATKPEVMGPPKPAVFEGKTRAEWFGDAAKRQGQDNAYSNEALAQAKPGQAPTYAPGSVEARAQALGNAMKTAQQGNQIVANLPKTPSSPNEQGVSTSYTTKETRPGDIDVVPKVKPPTSPNAQGLSDVIAKRQSQTAAPVNKLPPQPGIIRDDNPAPSSNASWFSSASKSLTQGAQTMMNDRAAKEAKLAKAEQRAKPGMEKVAEVAKGASIGAFTAAATPAKALAAPVQATIAGAQEAGRKIGETVNSAMQGVKNFMQGDQSAAQEAAKLKAEMNPTAEDKKKRVAAK